MCMFAYVGYLSNLSTISYLILRDFYGVIIVSRSWNCWKAPGGFRVRPWRLGVLQDVPRTENLLLSHGYLGNHKNGKIKILNINDFQSQL